MPRQATESTATTPAQGLALAALLSGATVTAAAEKAGVSRETVHRWLRDDPVFLAELNAGKAEILAATRAELRSLASEAVARLRALIADPDPEPHALPVQFRAACAVLKMVGADAPEPVGPTDPRDMANRLKSAAGARELEALIAGL